MISKVSISSVNNYNLIKSTPSFGLAKLNELGRSTADSFGFQHNDFLDAKMFKKQGVFQKSLLASKLDEGESFTDLCRQYGCSNNSKTNAEFIQNQILTSKSRSALKKVETDEKLDGLKLLYMSNYDNPELSTKQTKELLEVVRESIVDDDYVRFVGILEAGTK